MKRAITSTFFVAALALGGCVRVSPDAGFPDVEKLTLERTGKHVHWNQGTPEDDAAAKAVAAKLAGDLSVNDAVEVALLNNRGLQATFERLGIAQADLVQAGLLRNPLLDAEARFAGGGSGFHLGLAEDFLSVFFIPLRKRVAASEFEAAKLMVTGEVLDVAARARKAFYEAQASEQALDLRRTVFETTAASFDLSKRLHDAGNITLLDMSNDQAFYEQSKLDLAEAESEVLASRERLNVLMGAWGHETEWKLTSKLLELPDKELSSNDVEKQAIASSLDLAAVKQQFMTVAARLGIVRPGLLFQDASFGPNAEKDLGGGWSVGPEFSIPLPLFDQGQAAIAGVRAMLRRTQEEYAALAIEIRSRAGRRVTGCSSRGTRRIITGGPSSRSASGSSTRLNPNTTACWSVPSSYSRRRSGRSLPADGTSRACAITGRPGPNLRSF